MSTPVLRSWNWGTDLRIYRLWPAERGDTSHLHATAGSSFSISASTLGTWNLWGQFSLKVQFQYTHIKEAVTFITHRSLKWEGTIEPGERQPSGPGHRLAGERGQGSKHLWLIRCFRWRSLIFSGFILSGYFKSYPGKVKRKLMVDSLKISPYLKVQTLGVSRVIITTQC